MNKNQAKQLFNKMDNSQTGFVLALDVPCRFISLGAEAPTVAEVFVSVQASDGACVLKDNAP